MVKKLSVANSFTKMKHISPRKGFNSKNSADLKCRKHKVPIETSLRCCMLIDKLATDQLMMPLTIDAR